MSSKDIIDCGHCRGTGRCNCDACWDANGLDPSDSPFLGKAWRHLVPCKVCGGSGKVRIRSV